MKDASTISSQKIEQAVRQRYSPFPELTMELLSSQLNSFRIGELRPAARSWEIMLERDGELTAAASKRFSDAARLPWEIVSTEESAEAEAHAAALKYFYDHTEATTVLEADERGGLNLLIRQMLSAHAHRYSVHEMIWRVDNAGRREITAEFRHCPVWFFECRKGRLGFMANDFDLYGVPLQLGEWLVTVGLGHMRPASIAFGIKHFPLRDWMLYCSRFGLPGIHGQTSAQPGSTEWTNFEQALAAFANDWVSVSGMDTKINLVDAARASGALPFQELVERSDRLYSKLFRGGDLATSSRDNSVGAQGQLGETSSLLEDDAQLATDVLNMRVDRPVLRYLFGAEPKAWFKLTPPKRDNTERDLKTAAFLLGSGVPMGMAAVRERFAWPAPEEGEELVERPAPALPAVPPQAMANAKTLASRAQSELASAIADDMAPVRARLERLLQDLQEINLITDPEVKAARVAQWKQKRDETMRWVQTAGPQILKNPSAAKSLADLQSAALFGALSGDRALANFDPDQPRDEDGKWTDADGYSVRVSDSKITVEARGQKKEYGLSENHKIEDVLPAYAKVLRQQGADPSKYMSVGGSAPIRAGAKAVVQERIDKLKARSAQVKEQFNREFPAYDDIKREMAKEESASQAFTRAMERGDGRLPARYAGNLDALVKDNPKTVAYLKAESYATSTNAGKVGAGKKALTRLKAGDPFQSVMDDMEKEWAAEAERSVWNS